VSFQELYSTISQPYFSIVIPTYNRPQLLTACLASLTKLDYPRDRFEVIVVDDGSKLSLKDAIALFQESLHLTLISQVNAGPATARNTGARVARGAVLAFIDDDCQPTANWLRALELYFLNDFQISERPYAVGGQVHNILANNYYSVASQAIVDYLYEHHNTEPRNCRFITSNNLAVSTTDFLTIGGFDETFPLAAAEDREFCDRWVNTGYQLIYAPEATVYHTHDLTLELFWRQQFNYGRGAFHFYQCRTEQGFQHTQYQPWMFYLSLLHYPFRQYSLSKSLIVALLFLISQIAVLVGLLTERSR
jgi:GT2 family glycosyltransferase